MGSSITFFIPIIPVSWQIGALDGRGARPRIAGHPKLKAFQEAFAIQAKQYRPHPDMLSRPVSMTLNFFMPIPKGCKKDLMFHASKPDVTDLFKAVEDAMTGIFYNDDCQVWNTGALKFYALGQNKPGVAVLIEYS